MLDTDKITENFEKYIQYLTIALPDCGAVQNMLDTIGSRLASAPASSRTDRHNAFEGGLVDHSLRVLKFALTINKSMQMKLPVKSIIIASLFHDLGKVGDEKAAFYLPQDSDWHKKQGIMWKYNPDMMLNTTDRSLWLLQYFHIPVSQDEWQAIRLADGQYVDENKGYKMKECMLATIIHMADLLATKMEKIGEIKEDLTYLNLC